MKVDYIVVGCGLAGINFCELLKANGRTFVVFDDKSQLSSVVAGGLYNPVNLRRFKEVWKSQLQLELALPVYSKLEKELKVKLIQEIPVLRRFASTEEQNNWFAASDNKNLSSYLSTNIIQNHNPCIDAPFGFGQVLQTGRINAQQLVITYKQQLLKKGQLMEKSFDYDAFLIREGFFLYQNVESKHIVFAEGFGVDKNPFFKEIPIKHSKGELITIHAPDLNINYVLKANVFIFPIGNDQYRVGATYKWDDITNVITQKAKEELINKLKRVIKCPFIIIDQVAGIRPTVVDRRPLVGKHARIKNMFVLNGLGTRGVMIAPYVASQLYDYIENGKPLDKEIDIDRFNEDNP